MNFRQYEFKRRRIFKYCHLHHKISRYVNIFIFVFIARQNKNFDDVSVSEAVIFNKCINKTYQITIILIIKYIY